MPQESEVPGSEMRFSMEEDMVKIKIRLPANDASGVDAEWLWTKPEGDSFVLKNVPIFVYGLSYGDSVREE